MKKIITMLLICIFTCLACEKSSKHYHYSEFPNKQSISARKIAQLDSLHIASPLVKVHGGMCCIGDVMATSGHFFHLYTFPDFKHVKSFGRKGAGPNELLSISALDMDDNHLYAMSPVNRKIYTYDLSSTSLDSFDKVITIADSLSVFDIAVNQSDLFLSRIVSSSHRVKRLNMPDNKYKEDLIWDSLPLKPEDNFSSLCKIDYNPSGKYIVSTSLFGEVLAIQNIDKSSTTTITAIGKLGHPRTSMINGRKMPNHTGFTQLVCGNTYVYTVFSGAKTVDLLNGRAKIKPTINIYNYQGKPILQCITESQELNIFYCDEDRGELYAISNDAEKGTNIILYEIGKMLDM